MKKKIVSSKEIAENNFSLSPSDYIDELEKEHMGDSEKKTGIYHPDALKGRDDSLVRKIEVYVPESVTVFFILQPTGTRLYVDVPYNEDDRLCVSEAIIKLTTEQGINLDVMEYSWEVLIV